LVGGHRPHVGGIDGVGQVEQAAAGGLLDEAVEDLVDDVFEVGEEAIDRVSRRRSIEATAEPDDRVLEFSRDWTDAVDVLVVAVQERSEECWWVMISCSPRRAGANTSNSSRKSSSRCSNNASVSVAITLKNSSIEVSSCRMLALVDTVPTSCVFVCDAFYDTLYRRRKTCWRRSVVVDGYALEVLTVPILIGAPDVIPELLSVVTVGINAASNS